MAKFSIYSKDGSYIRYVGEPTYNGAFMGVPYLSFATIESITPIDWQRGDYVDYHRTGFRYKLYSAPEPIKQARRDAYGASFLYQNVRFYSAVKDLEIAPFRDLVPEDNDIHFSTRPEVSTFENVYGIAERIQECVDDIFPNQWEIRVFNTNDEDLLALFNEQKEYSVSNGSCLDALSKIYDTWKNVGWFHTYNSNTGKNVITIGRSCIRDAENTSEAYAYGLGKGLKSLKKIAANEEFATRLYVYGSDRNIQTRYYNGLDIHDKDSVNIVNLMLPLDKWGKTNGKPDARKAYLQADDALIEKYGLIPRTVYFDGSQNEEIYPSITGLTSFQVRQAMINAGHGDSPMLPNNINDYKIDQFSFVMFTDDTGDAAHIKANPTWEATVLGVGFDIAEQGKLTENGYATISMKSGECAGREFKVKKSKVNKDGQTLTIERTWDESLGMGFPNKHYSIKAGDQFVLLDVPMPDYCITLAQNRLLAAGEKMLADYTRVSAYYEPSLDPIKIKAGGKLLREGIYLQIYDEDIIDTENNRDYVLIDTLTIDEKGALPTYRVTLRDQKRASKSFDVLEDMIEDAKESTEKDIQAQKTYTDRRFRSAQETIDMLQEAFANFSEGINPVTVQTMAMLVGDESLQFKFTSSLSSLTDIPCPLSYDNTTKQLKANAAYLIHMTLGIDSITTKGAMTASDYLGWNMPSWNSTQFDTAEKRYYVYAKVPTTSGGTGEYILSESPIRMTDVSGYYHLLIGILNSEYNGTRDFVTLYGFTEVLPGQITTDIIKDADSNLVIDLINATITAKNGARIIGDVTFGKNSEGLSNLPDWQSLEHKVDNIDGERNYVLDSSYTAPSATANETHKYIARKVSARLSKGDVVTFNCENVNVLAGQATAFSAYIRKKNDHAARVVSAEVEVSTMNITKDKPYYTVEITENITNCEVVILLYAGVAGYTQGKKVEYSNISLVRGSKPMMSWIEAPEDTKERIQLVDATLSEDIMEINEKLDGVVENYFEDYVPSRTNEPAATWIAEGTEANHVGDTFTNVETTGENAGKSWRWLEQKSGSVNYDWQPIADTDALKALQEAAKAKETADGKSRTFIVEPFVPYDEGDIWLQGANGDLMVCVTPQGEDGSYSLSHWEKKVKYTDDSKVNELSEKISDDYGYLRNVFGQVTEGNAILGKYLGVGERVDESTFSVNAYLDGSGVYTSPLYGKLMLALGIPSSAQGKTDLKTRAQYATTQIFENGRIKSKDVDVEGKVTAKSGKIGIFEINEDNYLIADSSEEGRLSLQESGISFSGTKRSAHMGAASCGPVLDIKHRSDGQVLTCYGEAALHNTAIYAESTDAAFMCGQGMFYGLRPRIRRITASTTNIDLLEIDHTITIYGEGTKYVNLPPNGSADSIRTGQVYKIVICHNAAKVVIDSGTTKMWDLRAGGGSLTEFTITGYNVVDIIYDGNNWFLHTAH